MKYRLIEKTVDFISPEAGASESFDVGGSGCDSFSVVVSADIPEVETFDSGENELMTFTFQAVGDTDPGDYLVIYDTAGLAWAAAADITGTDPEPTGDVWLSIPAERKVMVDLSGETTDIEVAAAFTTALNALADVTFTADDTAADGTTEVSVDLRGACTAPDTFDEDDSGSGTISVAVDNAGVNSEVNVDADSVTIPAHNLATGVEGQLTTTGTLPDGLSTGTDYYIIVLDENTVQFAASYEDALSGDAIDLIDQGSEGAVNTFTPTALSGASVKLQQSNDNSTWVDLGSATNITDDATVLLEKNRPTTRYIRVYFALSAGYISASLEVLGKGDRDA